MVSHRCRLVVKDELCKLGLQFISLELGMVHLETSISDDLRQILKKNLMVYGLEVLEDKKLILIERIKNSIIEIIYYTEDIPKVNYSNFLSAKLGYDYTYLSNLFTEVKGITIQHYIIIIKIEKVKELILLDEHNLAEIAYKLHYSSASHLSKQFKKTTGVTPSVFKELKMNRSNNLENM